MKIEVKWVFRGVYDRKKRGAGVFFVMRSGMIYGVGFTLRLLPIWDAPDLRENSKQYRLGPFMWGWFKKGGQ